MKLNDKINVIKDGNTEIIAEDELIQLFANNKEINVKLGFDPTTSNLHLGHVVVLKKLKQLQDFGCNVKLLIGDFTALIGDPTGRNSFRKQLTKIEIYNNYSTYTKQVFKFLDYKHTQVLFNSSWFNLFNLEKFITLASMTTVSRLLERSDFKKRYNLNIPIRIHEFFYPLLQAYDSVFIKSDIEIGGIDQKFNCLLGRELQKKFKCKQQSIVMVPILTGIDGVLKMSKSADNYINIIDKPYDIFCKIMSIPDTLISEYFIILGIYSFKEYNILKNKIKNLMELKYILASSIVTLFYSKKDGILMKQKFINQVCKKEIPDDICDLFLMIETEQIFLFEVLKRINLLKSLSEAKRFIKQRSIKVDNCIIEDKKFLIKKGNIYVLQIGKRKFVKLFIK